LDLRNFTSDVARPVGLVATRKSELTAGRLVITVVPMTS
jgi:hypothetical protein